ncbi:MAG: hypothetical protein KDD70_12935 [Bdellovibrionales bacterium]|nr:hypothetical protein [Bdellovibrionales bacterium]
MMKSPATIFLISPATLLVFYIIWTLFDLLQIAAFTVALDITGCSPEQARFLNSLR